MTIRNITNVALAVAAIAFAAPMAHAQNGGYNPYNGTFYGYNPYSPNAYGIGPYRYNPGGALVLGANGQLYNPFLGNGGAEPTLNVDGISVPAPVVPIVSVPVAEPTPTRMSDQIDMVRLSSNRIRIKWSGDPRPIATMTFSLLDKNRIALKSTMLSDMPAQAVFTVPSNAAYYRVVITYNDGAMRSLVSAL